MSRSRVQRKRPPVSREAFLDEVRKWAVRIGAKPKRVQVREMSRKWASCSTEGRLTFAEDLLAQPRRFRDEVIVHEIVHLLVPNHGKLFRAMMTSFLGGWPRGRESGWCRVGAASS